MMRTRALIFAIAILPFASNYARERTSEESLRYWLSQPDSAGGVFSQGKLDGVDYRKLLRGAVAYDRASLVGIFRYTANGQLMGEGAETNCEILHALLEHWGDSRFVAVLSRQSKRVRRIVIAEIDYSWRYPGWQPTEFPKTYRLTTHEKIPTSPP